MKKKDLEKYRDEYGHVPRDFFERFKYLLSTVQLNNKDLIKLREKVNSFLKLKWEKDEYCIYFTPKASPRPRLSGRTKKFYVSDAKSNNTAFKKFCKEIEMDKIIDTPCKILIESYFPTPKMNKINMILSELKLIRPISRPDWDNLGKTYSDMIQDTAILDDSLIVDGRSVKYFSIKPRINIIIEYMPVHDSLYNKNKVMKWSVYEQHKNEIKEKDHL